MQTTIDTSARTQLRMSALVTMAVAHALPRAILASETSPSERRDIVLTSNLREGNWFDMGQDQVKDIFWNARTQREMIYVTDRALASRIYDQCTLRNRSIRVNGIPFTDDQNEPSFLITSLVDAH